MVIAIDSQNATILYGTYVVALGDVKVKPDKQVRKRRATNATSKPIAIIPIVTFISAHSLLHVDRRMCQGVVGLKSRPFSSLSCGRTTFGLSPGYAVGDVCA